MKKLVVVAFLFLTWVSKRAFAHSITVDGDPADWWGNTASVNDTSYIDAGEAIWVDSRGDDTGDGGDAANAPDNPSGYTYPLDTTFTHGEADLIQGRITAAGDYIYFLIQVDSFTSSYYPIVVITMDIDSIPGSGNMWIPQDADLMVDSILAWEYAVVLGDNGIMVFDKSWNNIADSVDATVAFNPNGGYIEAGINARKLYPAGNILDSTITYTCVLGINQFGKFKEVDDTATQWHGGGGLGYDGSTDSIFWIEPDVYDMAFVHTSEQVSILSSYEVIGDTLQVPAVIPQNASSSLPMPWVYTGVVEKNNRIVSDKLPILFARDGKLVLSDIAGSVVLYRENGTRAGKYENVKEIDMKDLNQGTFYAVIKTHGTVKKFKVVNLK